MALVEVESEIKCSGRVIISCFKRGSPQVASSQSQYETIAQG